MTIDQDFEAYLAHVVGMAGSWTTGEHPPNLVKAIAELREYYYAKLKLLREAEDFLDPNPSLETACSPFPTSDG